MQIVVLIIGLILLYMAHNILMGFLAWLNFGTGFLVIAAILFAIALYCKFISMKVDKNVNWNAEKPETSNYYGGWIICIFFAVIFGVLGGITPHAVDWQKEADIKNEAREVEKAEKEKAEAEQKAQQAAAEAERKAQREAEEKEKASHADEYVRTWCSRMRTLINDTNEQWEYWWPIATGSHDIATDYDAANTLNINLKQYLNNSEGESYKIPEYATDEQKNQMQEIEKKFRDSLWKRIRASEKYAEGLKSGNFDLDDASGIRRRANEADISAVEASNLLKDLELAMGIQ